MEEQKSAAPKSTRGRGRPPRKSSKPRENLSAEDVAVDEQVKPSAKSKRANSRLKK